jgi:SAM-dependent methyltransferase
MTTVPRPEPAAELARRYDLDMQDDPGDVDLYLALGSRTGSPVLELAVGSGRVAVPLAAAGHDVTGVDIDRHMLARAEARWAREVGATPGGRLDLVEGDVRDARLGRRYRLVVLALNALLLLPDLEAQEAALRTAAEHLEPGGLVVVDVALLDAEDLVLYDGRLTHEWLRPDPESGDLVSKVTSARHDAVSGSVDLVTWFDAAPASGGPVTRLVRRDRLSLLTADQLLRLARSAGLEVEELAGDYLLTPLGPGSTRVVLVARLV